MAEPTRESITVAEVDTSRPNKIGIRTTDNRWFGCFDKKLAPRFEVGAHLNVEWITAGDNGQYRNILGVLGTARSANGAAPASDRERNIVREAALKAACDLYNHVSQMDDQTLDWILHTADRFAAWVTQTGEEAPF